MMLLGQQPVGGANLRQRAAPVQAERGVVVGDGVLQIPSLLGDGVNVSFIGSRRLLSAGQEVRAFEQAAEIFFAGDDFRAGLAGQAGVGFVFHFEPFEPDDADKLSVFFPDLGLGEFHGVMVKWASAGVGEVAAEVCLSCFGSGETITSRNYFFLAAGFLAAAFFGAGLLALDFTTGFTTFLARVLI